MELNELKPFLRDYVESITTQNKGGLYNCPLCGSGTGAHKTGAFSIAKDGLRWKCFACNENGDIFDLVSKVENMTASEAASAVLSRYGGGLAQQQPRKAKPATKAPARSESVSFKADIERFAAALEGSEGQRYLEGRGFTLETMKRFKLGYDAQQRAVTIPYNPKGSYYGKRSVIPDSERPHNNLKGVTMPLFNVAALYSSEVVFVVESPLCAISISQVGGAAIAISGTGGGNRLIEQLKKEPTQATLVLCMDNDDAGRKATETIGSELEALNVFCVDGTTAIMGGSAADYRKDPNEVLQRSGAEALRQVVEATAAEALRLHNMTAQEEAEELQRQTGAGMVDSFLQDVQTRKYEPMPTGITDIDRAIGGGFIRQQLILLGAAPGAGKTALAQWIFEGMARKGTRCIYLNLEMSREQVLARSFARIAAKNGHKLKTTDILQGYKWTDVQRSAVIEAAEEYKATIAPCMIYNPDNVTANLDDIISYIDGEAQRAKAAGMAAPVVVLDYLQIIGSSDPREDAATLIKRAVMMLKGYAMRHDTIVFVIVAHNRAANSTGDISMESGRDTSALEYSADLQLGLTFTKCLRRDGDKGKKPDELDENERKFITLRILKGRFGGMGREVDLIFEGETMTYSQLEKGFTPTNEPTPFDINAKRRCV